MSIATWLRTPRIRRGLAASAVLLAAGGLILFRAPAGASTFRTDSHVVPLGQGTNFAQFSGPGVHGQISLSQAKVLAGTPTQVFAEVRMIADASEARERAPLSMAIVLDTSGSMEGDKIDQAKDSVIRLIRDMRDDDEVAFIRYSDDASVVQQLARVGTMRDSLVREIRGIQAGGGTSIPSGLNAALAQLGGAWHSRVRHIVLASDGLDSTRAEAQRLAVNGFQQGITVSSMGIGLDFDESYMSGLARAGHGNFAFVKDGAALAGFLKRELVETASTTIENATVQMRLPESVRFVRATGADATQASDGTLTLRVGSMFSGDERRIIVELDTQIPAGDARGIGGLVQWTRVGAGGAEAGLGNLILAATTDLGQANGSRDGRVLASATSVSASQLQLEVAEAYAKGDALRAQALMDQSEKDLECF